MIQARSRSGRSAGWPDLKLTGRWASSASLACARLSPRTRVSSSGAGAVFSSGVGRGVVEGGHRLLEHPVVVRAVHVVEDLHQRYGLLVDQPARPGRGGVGDPDALAVADVLGDLACMAAVAAVGRPESPAAASLGGLPGAHRVQRAPAAVLELLSGPAEAWGVARSSAGGHERDDRAAPGRLACGLRGRRAAAMALVGRGARL